MNIFGMVIDLIAKLGGWFLSWFGDKDEVKAIQARVVAMCGFLPTAASVAAMLSASNPTVTGVIGIATAICQVASSSKVMGVMATTGGMVNGVPVEGDWVIKK